MLARNISIAFYRALGFLQICRTWLHPLFLWSSIKFLMLISNKDESTKVLNGNCEKNTWMLCLRRGCTAIIKLSTFLNSHVYAKHHLNSCYKIFKTPLNIGFYMLLYLQNVHTITARWLLNQLKLQSRWFIFMIWNSTKKCLRFLSLYEKDGRTPSFLA